MKLITRFKHKFLFFSKTFSRLSETKTPDNYMFMAVINYAIIYITTLRAQVLVVVNGKHNVFSHLSPSGCYSSCSSTIGYGGVSSGKAGSPVAVRFFTEIQNLPFLWRWSVRLRGQIFGRVANFRDIKRFLFNYKNYRIQSLSTNSKIMEVMFAKMATLTSTRQKKPSANSHSDKRHETCKPRRHCRSRKFNYFIIYFRC